jgi:hypothetical protein
MSLIAKYSILLLLLSSLSAVAQNKSLTTIPFEQHSGWTFIKVFLNGKDTLNFVFDTGAGAETIDVKVADSLHLASSGRTQLGGATGDVTAEVYDNNTLEIGAVKLGGITLMGTPMAMSLKVGIPVHGIIGMALLKKFVVSMNEDEKLFSLLDPRGYQPSSGTVAVPIKRFTNSGFAVIEMSCILKNDEKITTDFLVDCGAANAIGFSSRFDTQNNIQKKIGQTVNVYSMGISQDKMSNVRGRVKEVLLGSYSLKEVTVGVSKGGGFLGRPGSPNGLVGNSLLNHFNITYDYVNRVIYFSPAKNFSDTFPGNCTGLNIAYADMDTKRIIVKGVLDNSPASQTGMQERDEIMNINGKNTKSIGIEETEKMLLQCNGKIRLKIKRGNIISDVTLEPWQLY